MNKTPLLTAHDIDLFAERLKATIAHAQRALALEAKLAQAGLIAPRSDVSGRGPSQPKKVKLTKIKRPRAARQKIDSTAVLATLKDAPKDGLPLRLIAQATGANPVALREVLHQLREAKTVRMTGAKAGARYHAA